MCDYQGYEFGACYLDSQCVDGYLMDADSEIISSIPCPECNHFEWLNYGKEDIENQGYGAFIDGEPPIPPYHPTYRLRYPTDAYQLRQWWLDGYREAVEKEKKD